MKLVDHTVAHVFVHVALFTAFALLIPVITVALNDKVSPLSISPTSFTASLLLIVVCVYLLHKIKDSFTATLRSFGSMLFLPGFLNVLFSLVNFESFLSSFDGVTGMAVIKPVAVFYVEHSVPSILSVAALYMAIGGVLYWSGNVAESIRVRFSPNPPI